ncbi:condensation protein [Micromonospora sp. ATA32]|nr:condensation protein [Micromonospora sp. ATA32]
MDELPASVGQRLLWLMDHYRGHRNSLNEQVVWHLRGPLDRAALEMAVRRLHERHDALRTTFVTRRRQFFQVVNDPQPVAITEHDVSDGGQPRLAARDVLTAELTTPIDVSLWPTRVMLLRLAPEHHVVVLTMHHYVSDDWSNALLSRDIRALYAGEPLPEVQWQYPQWAAWHREQVEGERGPVLTDYWRQQLDGARLLQLPQAAQVARTPGEPASVCVELTVGPQVAAGLRALARQHRTTLFPVMLSLFYLALQRATGQSDLTVATLFANRARPEVADTVGFFVTMALLRAQVKPGEPLGDLVRRTRSVVMGGLRHQELPSQLLPPGTVGGEGRTDDVMFHLLGSMMSRADMAGDELDDLEAQLDRSRFALEFVVVPQGDDLTALVLCERDRFLPEWAQALVKDYVELAAAAVGQPAAPVG